MLGELTDRPSASGTPPRARAEQLTALFESGKVLSADDSGGLIPAIAESAAFLLAAEYASVSLADGVTRGLTPVYSWPRAASRTSEPQASVLRAPLVGKAGELLGEVEVRTDQSARFSEIDQRLLQAFAAQAAAALESSRLIQELSEGKHAWEETFDAIGDGICVRDQQCRLVRANRGLAQLLGRPVIDLLGTRLCDQLPELEPTCNVCHAPPEWDDAQADLLGKPRDLRLDREEPRLLTVTDFPARLSDVGIVSWVTLVKDVTNERRLQETLVRSERLRAIGEMASGVAHDFNNLLSTILHRSEVALNEPLQDDLRRSVETIRSAALDGVATVRRIQEYSRVRHDPQQQTAQLDQALEAAIELARHRWVDSNSSNPQIEVEIDVPPLPAVSGDASELREVFMNLIINAVDAMPMGGKLRIAAEADENVARVRVTDSGVGMSEDVQTRIFDPFFTTKGERGNGLGLSIAVGFVTRSGGRLEVESAPGQGSTFTVTLPIAAAPLAEPLPEPAAGPPLRILLVDDDDGVRDGLQLLLRQDGHRVDAYQSGREALDRYVRGHYDCIITDLAMPEVGGWEFAQRLRSTDDAVPLILLTGWRAQINDQDLEQHGVNAVLSKPATRAELRLLLSRVARDAGLTKEPGAALSLNVLVVDDQAQFADAVADRLRLEGCEVTVASSVEEATAAADANRFDFALIDFRLSEQSGLDVADVLRRRPDRPYLVLTSGLALSNDDPDLLERVDAVLPKPWRPDELRGLLAAAGQWQQQTAAQATAKDGNQ
jgi:signal transduction histidine kinase/DNA-binding response OmpR family regulator